MKQREVHFYSEGFKIVGDYFLPDDMKKGEKRPGIVLCHGYSGIRPLILPDYAKVFVAAGFSLPDVRLPRLQRQRRSEVAHPGARADRRHP
jgi:cephalosporin-C deacetylase-like acetyl esterase